MRLLFDIGIATAIAVVLGFSTAWYALDRGNLFGAVTIGQWTAWPRAGSPDADPYTIAMLARTGEAPLGAGEGIAFTATRDRDGDDLDGRCSYLLIGQTPAARLWTITAYDEHGHLMPNPARRPGFHSREIVRRPDGSFVIAMAPDIRPGNWLPLARVDRFRLVLRLYDTPLTTGGSSAESTMPEIVRESCG